MNSVNFTSNTTIKAENTSKNKKSRNIKGNLAATGASLAIGGLASIPSMLIGNYCASNNSKLTKKEIETINKQADHLLNNLTNLGKKGLKIIHMDPSISLIDTLPPLIQKLHPVTGIVNGKNAAFNPATNKILVNRDKLPLSIFHEMGHAFNFNNSKFWKAMQKGSLISGKFAPFIMLVPAFTKKEVAAEGEELTKKQKIKNGIRESSPFIASALMIPTLLEEGKASLRANKWAKEVLNPNYAKQLSKSNAFAYATYVITAIGFGLATYAAKKVKDNFDEKKAMKANNIN